jgi:hypothetical protein
MPKNYYNTNQLLTNILTKGPLAQKPETMDAILAFVRGAAMTDDIASEVAKRSELTGNPRFAELLKALRKQGFRAQADQLEQLGARKLPVIVRSPSDRCSGLFRGI